MKHIIRTLLILGLALGTIGCSQPETTGTTLVRGNFPNEYAIRSPGGQRIFIDIISASQFSILPKDLGPDDILIVTNDTWYDVYDPKVVEAFPGRKLIAEAGSLRFADGVVSSIPGKYGETDPRHSRKGGYFLIDIVLPDVHIVHCGQTAQSTPTEEQVPYLKNVDILIGSLHIGSDDAPTNKVRFPFFTAVAPKIFIPAGLNKAKLKAALAVWPGYCSMKNHDSLRVSPALLAEKSTKLVLLDPSLAFVSYLRGELGLKDLDG